MTELERALLNAGNVRAAVGLGYVYRTEPADFETILDAAYKYFNLTSLETIEKAARKLVEQNRADGLRVTDFAWAAASEGFKQVWKTRAEALLLSLLEEA